MKKSKTIFSKTFVPVLAILLLVIGAYMLFINQYILKSLRDNVLVVYEEQMINRRNDMENQMLKGWSALNGGAEQITEAIEEFLDNKGYDLSQIKQDIDLNQEILINITNDMIHTLKTSGTTEVFLVLDGEGSHENNDVRAGVYIRNTEPGTYLAGNSNLLFERGVPAISKGWQLPLDSYWQAGFLLPEEEGNEYFYKPLQAAQESDNKDFRNFGYWSYGNIIDEKDLGILSYSVPLIGNDGTVFGVLGVGINENLLMKNFNYNQRDREESSAYILAKTVDGKNFTPYAIKGESYSKTSILASNIELQDENDNIVHEMVINAPNKMNVCINRQDFRFYSYNTPFEEEQWSLLGMQKKEELFSSYYMVKNILKFMLIISSLLCTMCVFWFSKFISVPIQQMVLKLRKSDPYRPIMLNKVYIEEIDELADSIKNLSARVADAYSKISTIIQMSDSGIAVFEYVEKENLMFCSQGFFEMMGYEQFAKYNEYVDATEFKHYMHDLLYEDIRQDGEVKEVSLKDGRKRWIRITSLRDEDSILGVITDVTTNILEKRKIEYERDHDVLTDLMNRRAFEEKMSDLQQGTRDLKKAAMLVWDMDNLKYVNDTYGHSIGDAYLIAFANCLKEFSKENVISARRSGDEFITFIYGYDEEVKIEELIGEMWALIQEKYITLPDRRRYKIRISMGRSWYPKDSLEFDTLFQYADFAMYMVKHNNKGTMEDFNHTDYQENRILLQGQEAFHYLLEQKMVNYMLQPIVSVEDGSIYGYEMLMRSKFDVFKSPMDVLKIAHSESKLYDVEVMTWFESMETFVAKVNEGVCDKNSKVFINSIANQIMNEENLELFNDLYGEYLSNIVCEVTEKEQENENITKEKIDIMESWGGLIALDDYGDGYNSESALLRISPNIVKIDMSIVRGVDKDDKRRRLVANLALYTKERDILLLAEGVETKEELKTLVSLGVQLLQGYYIAKPSYDGRPPAKEVIEELRAGW